MKRSIVLFSLLICGSLALCQSSAGAANGQTSAPVVAQGSAAGETQQNIGTTTPANSNVVTPAQSGAGQVSTTTPGSASSTAVSASEQGKSSGIAASTAQAPIPGSLMNTQPPSAELQQHIEKALSSEPTLNGSSISVNVTDTEIAISGSVDTGKQKVAAERIAESFATNRRVRDTVTVTSARAPISSRGGMNASLPAGDRPSTDNGASQKAPTQQQPAAQPKPGPPQQGDQDPNVPKS